VDDADLRAWPGRRVAAMAACLVVTGFCAAVLVSFGPVHPFSLAEHFRLQLLLGGVAVAALAGALALGAGWLDARWFDAAMFALLVDACVIVPDLASARREAAAGAAAAPVRVLFVNVHTSSQDFAAVRRLITGEQADIVGLVETDARWLRELAPALEAYPARIEAPRSDNFGMALYARDPLTGAAEHLAATVPAILAETSVGGARVALALLHPLPPVSAAVEETQLRHFDAVAARVRGAAAPFVILGDLNAAPWSRAFARLRGATGACDTRAGFGAQTSFPAGSWLLRIPIDHVLVACSIGVRDRRIGPDVGSDHLPVIADLLVPR